VKNKKFLAVASYEKQQKKDKIFAIFFLTFLITLYLIITKL
tara:strand:+ start:172 stop:294 length:123 start_codon:yes stop_codon:yes gene_type:complete